MRVLVHEAVFVVEMQVVMIPQIGQLLGGQMGKLGVLIQILIAIRLILVVGGHLRQFQKDACIVEHGVGE